MTGSIILGQKFRSKDELFQAAEKYAREQGVPYVTYNCTKAETYNKDAGPKRQMPIDQVYKDLVISCKHYGKPRQSKHKEGKQKRGNQRTFKRYCIAKFNTCYNLSERCHIVTKLEEGHCNHAVDKKFAKHYPEFRKPSTQTIEKVQVLFENEAKTHRIRDVLLNSGVLATAQDIQNLRNRWLASFKGKKESEEDALFQQLKKLKEEDTNAVVVIHYDEQTNVINSIFFQTSYMRESLEQFPELLIMDTTYKICDNEMPLIVFSVVDCFGAGRIAGYAVIFSESRQIVTAALNVLKLGCEKFAEEIKVIYVDKAQSEIAAIKEVLPNAEIHLCDYHVKDTFNRTSVKKLVKENWDDIEKHLMTMIHAHTKEVYDKAYESLDNAAGGKDSDFMVYFNKNWHNCGLVWSDYQRNESFTLGERTTGRVESHNAKIKIMVDKKLPVSQVIFKLCVLNRNSCIENSQRVFNEMSKTKYHKYSADPVLQQILKVNTPFVGDFLRAQYERSLEPPSDSVHNVTLKTCDCKYFNQSRLICSHIFRERRLKGQEIYDHKLVPQRWIVILPSAAAANNFTNFEIITSPVKTSKSKKVMSQEERYNLAESISKRISSYVANFGGDEYHHRINAMQNFEDLMRMGKRVVVIGVNGEGHLDVEQVDSNEKSVSKESYEIDLTRKDQEGDDLSYKSSAEGNCKDKGQEILVSEMLGVESYSVLTPSKESKLKLPIKCPVPGRPKGKRGGYKKTQSKKDTGSGEEDADDVTPVLKDQCTSCRGPVTCYTSCSKQNRGKKYIICKNTELAACKDFRKWLEDDMENVNKQETNCIVCAASGPPSLDGGHKCNTCGVPVHAIDGVPCCSINTNPDEEGFGGNGRKCLKCFAVGSKDEALNDTSTLEVNPSQNISACYTEDSCQSSAGSTNFLDSLESAQMSPPKKDKLCFGCGKLAVLRTSGTSGNYGRRFYTCGDPKFPKCKWMNWKDKKRILPQTGLLNNERKTTSFLQQETTQLISEVPRARISHGPPARMTSLLEDGLNNILLNVADKMDPSPTKELGNDVKPDIRFSRPLLHPEPDIITLSDDSGDELQESIIIRSGNNVNPNIQGNKPLLYPNPPVIILPDDYNELQKSTNKRSGPVCVVCSVGGGPNLTSCQNCRGQVHAEECSINAPNSSGPVTSMNRLCKNCFCLLCKGVRTGHHTCVCCICNLPLDVSLGVICYRCERICHDLNCSTKTVAREKNNANWYLCQHCSHTLCIPVAAWSDLKNNKMLTDHHVQRASELLRQQFSNEIDGLCYPLAVTCGKKVEELHHYPRRNNRKHYVQIMHTGSAHWVTSIFEKGATTVKILDSLKANDVSGHIKIQICMIAQTAGAIRVARPAVQQQTNSIDCCLYAIAHATEFCFTKSVQFIEYDESMLRQHWIKCLEIGEISPFPRVSKRPKKTKYDDDDISVIKVNCTFCLLPDNYADMIGCDYCVNWFHKICVELKANFKETDPWSCFECAKDPKL